MKWKWRNGQTETCQFDYLEDEEGWTILEASGVTTNDNPHLDLIASAPELLVALEGLFKECAMIHKYGGDACNQKEADLAIDNAKKAISKAKGE